MNNKKLYAFIHRANQYNTGAERFAAPPLYTVYYIAECPFSQYGHKNLEVLGMERDILLTLIGYGADNGIHLADLVRLTGLSRGSFERGSRRSADRVCVIAPTERAGYYYPSTYAELSHYVKRTEKQAKSILFTLKAARRKRRRWRVKQTCRSRLRSL